jgi:hypothetical protein
MGRSGNTAPLSPLPAVRRPPDSCTIARKPPAPCPVRRRPVWW